MMLLKINHNGIEIYSIELVEGTEYVAGRDEGSQIRLQDPAISRRHFRIFHDGTEWKIENISKFGKLLQGGAPITVGTMSPLSAFAVPPYQISLIEKLEEPKYEAPANGFDVNPESKSLQNHYEDSHDDRESHLHRSIQQIAAKSSAHQSSEDAIEKTWVASMAGSTNSDQGVHVAGYLTIIETDQEDALWKLDRNPEGEDQWIVGRDVQCQVQATGVGVSRKHFEIRQREGNFFIADLKSSKGTLLNGVKLKARTEVPLRSGDQVVFANSIARFELRDENFERGLSNLPVPFEPMGTSIQTLEMRHDLMIQESTDESPMGNEDTNDVPYFMGPVPTQGGYPSAAYGGGIPTLNVRNNKPLLIRVVIGIGALVLVGYQIFSGDGPKDPATTHEKTQASKDPLALLTKEQKEDLETSYRFADTLMKRNNYQAALREIEKIHELVPNFKNSKKLEADCKRAIEAQQRREQMQTENKRMAETKKKVNEIVDSCKKMSERTQDIPSVQSCLTPALELDPSNMLAQEIITRMEAAKDTREKAQQAASAHKHKVGNGEDLYQKASQLKTSGRLLLAVQAYESHIRSGYPDPKNLKDESKRQIASIKSDIQMRIESAMKVAQENFDNQKYKESVKQLDRALDLDPENEKAAEMRSNITADLYKKMKVIYSDSVLEENLGRIEEAKEKWKQIVATDISSGEYFQKAKSKLAKYGER